jgi:hypothetical protein
MLKPEYIKKITLFTVIIALVYTGLPCLAQKSVKALKGTEIVEHLEKQAITPQKALNGVISFESLLEGGSLINNEPQILYTIAQYKIYLGYKHNEVNYAANSPDEYVYFEEADIYIYNGKSLKKIIKNYPASPIADDAAYMLATIQHNVDCKGDTFCQLNAQIDKYRPLFKGFHSSPFIYHAIQDINDLITPLANGNNINELDKSTVQKLHTSLDRYYNLLKLTKDDNKTKSFLLLARSYNNLGDKNKAKFAYQYLIDNYKNTPDANQARYELSRL